MITILSRRHAALVFQHLRTDRGLTRRDVAARLFLTAKTVGDRERQIRTIIPDEAIDHAHVLGFDLALVPQRHAGARPTGTGWPA
ncbi:helix-turn-helix domain-containing protein [Actinoplanes sp. NPDC051470]|uniref:helix-turn-helix domain-containing protein n=1 Tax=Actinoplanes sp. NPDC051470 TaxID=3157224 RepID=UPI003412BD3F